MKQSKNSSNLTKVILAIIILIPLNLIFDYRYGLLNVITSAALFFAIFFAVLLLVKALFSSKEAKRKEKMPELTKEKEAHYEKYGMSDQEIKFFRETMADARKQIKSLEENMQEVAKLKAINLRYDTIKACKAMFKEIVKEPHKLHQSDRFLYNHLPNLVALTDKYIEINNHELKNKDTYEALNQSAAAIEEVSQLVIKDYADFVKDDLDDLDVEISIAQQNIERDKDLEDYKMEKEQL